MSGTLMSMTMGGRLHSMTSREYGYRIRKAASRAANFTATAAAPISHAMWRGRSSGGHTQRIQLAWLACQRGRRSKRMTIDRFPAPPEWQRAYRVPAMIERRALMSGFTVTARSAAAEPGPGMMLGVGALARWVSVGTRRGHPRSTLCLGH